MNERGAVPVQDSAGVLEMLHVAQLLDGEEFQGDRLVVTGWEVDEKVIGSGNTIVDHQQVLESMQIVVIRD